MLVMAGSSLKNERGMERGELRGVEKGERREQKIRAARKRIFCCGKEYFLLREIKITAAVICGCCSSNYDGEEWGLKNSK